MSVVVAAYPDEGFVFLRDLAAIVADHSVKRDHAKAAAIVRKIVRGNLKKNRLMRAFPAQVDELMKLLD